MKKKTEHQAIARKLPKSYALTEQQISFREVTKQCGIVKGITRQQLVDRMQHCVPDAWKKIKEQKEREQISAPS
jgi:hypothetical protein